MSTNVFPCSGSFSTAVIGISFTVALFCLLAAVVVVWWWRKGTGDEAEVRTEINPTYGLYYFDDGNRIDDSNSEVVDGNIYYHL